MTLAIPRWSQLRPIGESPLAKSALAVPILGYLILLSGKFIEWFTLHSEFCGAGHCDVLWKLQCLYFGGWAFAIAAVVYWIACPPEVKSSASLTEFVNAEKAYMASGLNDRFREMVQRYASELAESLTWDDLAMVYSRADETRPFWRATLVGLYGIGGLLVLAPTVYTLVQVLRGTFR